MRKQRRLRQRVALPVQGGEAFACVAPDINSESLAALTRIAQAGIEFLKRERPKSEHSKHCRYRLAAEGAAAIECEHGYGACTRCDPCTCYAGG